MDYICIYYIILMHIYFMFCNIDKKKLIITYYYLLVSWVL
nr:CPPV075 hypothetical protein [Cooks petrelpox virus]